MRILFVIPYCPIPTNFGGAIRVYHMLNALALSHEVTVVMFGSRSEHDELSRHLGSRVRAINTTPLPVINKCRRLAQLFSHSLPRSFYFMALQSRAMQHTLDDVTDARDFDVIHMEFPMMGNYRIPDGPLRLLDSHNVEYDNFRRMELNAPSLLRKFHYQREYLKIREEELRVCRAQDLILVTSTRDKAILDADIPNVPKEVVPNGVDTTFFSPSREASEPHSIVFTGMMGYIPNSDGMLYFLDAIFPLIKQRIPDVKIYIVGKGSPPRLLARRSSNVIITGCVEDVRPYIWRSSVYVVPLRMGGGTRLKVLEAMAMAKPIVTTSIGCEGINCSDGTSVLVADNPEDFADRVIELMGDRKLVQRLTHSGYELVHSQYDWSIIYQQVSDIYESLAETCKRGSLAPARQDEVPTVHRSPAIANT